MVENTVAILSAVTAIVLGVMNFIKHRHLERDMKQYPLIITMELSYSDRLEPQARITHVRRRGSSTATQEFNRDDIQPS